jgi:hypothetical protein
MESWAASDPVRKLILPSMSLVVLQKADKVTELEMKNIYWEIMPMKGTG